ncbi:MAG: thermostable hemolysin delta-VPH [Clostridiales bacterium]|nr:thermostable hemolysin delta-VPH [Clostridiales bacterium]
MHFNYHAKIKKIIQEDIVVKIEVLSEYHNISPCMLLHFKNHPPMPIREHKWDDYIALLFPPT